MKYLNVVVWATAAVVIAILIATVLYVNREAHIRRDNQVQTCERGNTLRQTVNTIIVQVGLADDIGPLPIVDCEAAVK